MLFKCTHQLSTADTSEVDGQLETLHQQKILLEKQVADLQQTLKSVGSERDQANQQYQQYVQQLNGQLQSLASKVLTYVLMGIIMYLVHMEALCMIMKTLKICNKSMSDLSG